MSDDQYLHLFAISYHRLTISRPTTYYRGNPIGYKGGLDLGQDAFPTKAAFAYTTLRERIVSGYYRPGENLIITRLRDDLGVSESAIREATNRLQGERLLESTPHTGVRVMGLTAREAEELFELRVTLETLAAQKAMPGLTPADRQHLREINDSLRATLQAGELAAAADFNRQFHELIYRRAGSLWMLRIIQQLWDHSERLRASLLVLGADRRDLQADQHDLIMTAFDSGDPGQVAHAMGEHLKTALKVYQEYLRLFTA